MLATTVLVPMQWSHLRHSHSLCDSQAFGTLWLQQQWRHSNTMTSTLRWQYYVHMSLQFSHTHTPALFPGLPGSAGIRKVKPIWILLKQETVSGSGISWAIGKSAPCSKQITTPAPQHSVFTGRMPFLLPNQQHQSTEGKLWFKQ